jgi:inositol transporter-like SP family MFS transporter
MTTTRSATRHAWWVAFLSGMVSYLDAGAIVTTGTALVLYGNEFGFGIETIAPLSSILTFAIAVGALIGGRLGDRFGRRRIFLLTLSLFAIGAAVLTFAPGTAWLYPGIILLGFAAGADLPVSMSMIAEAASDANRGKMVSFTHILWMGGVIIVSLLGALFGDLGVIAARILYGHLLVIAVVVLVLRLRLPESKAWQTTAALMAVDPEMRGIRAFKPLLTRRYLSALVATGVFYALVNIAANINGQFSTYMYTTVAGAKVSTASTIGMIITIVSAASLLLLMRIVDGRRRMIWFTIMAVLSLVAFMIPAIVGVTVGTLVVFGVLYSIGGAVAGEPMYKVWSQELFPTQFRATAQGMTMFAARLVAALVALVTPALVAWNVNGFYWVLAGVTLLSCLVGIFWIFRIPAADDSEVEAAPVAVSA